MVLSNNLSLLHYANDTGSGLHLDLVGLVFANRTYELGGTLCWKLPSIYKQAYYGRSGHVSRTTDLHVKSVNWGYLEVICIIHLQDIWR